MQPALYSRPNKPIGRQFIPILLSTFLIPSLGHAQERQSQNSISEPTGDGGVQANPNAAILQELQAMRNRIEQLEAQLRAQSTAKSVTTPSTDAAERLETARQSLVAAGTEPVVFPAMRPSIATAAISAQKPATTPATTSEKSAPFAFADFTWLNRNGITPPGGNAGAPGSVVPGWTPDLRNSENRMTAAMLVKF